MSKLWIFDCDGVLVDSEVIAIRTEAALLTEIGMAMSEEEIAKNFVGLSYSDMMSALEQRFAGTVPDGFEARVQEEVMACLPSELTPIAGIGTMLARNDGPRCVASSSSPERIALSLRITGLDAAFAPSVVFSSSLVEHGKPAPDLFLYAAHTMGFRPADCIVIEDSPHGVAAARAAGMTAIGFGAGGHMRPSSVERLAQVGAHHVVDTVDQLEQLLVELSPNGRESSE